MFVTQKEKVDKLPSQRGTKETTKPAKKKRAVSRTPSPTKVVEKKPENLSPARAVVKDVTYRKLRPEVKSTLEKIVYQIELVGKTLQMLESRIIDTEDKL